MSRFIASRSIALALRGVPAIYLHGLLGSQNDAHDVLITRVARAVNRHNIDEATLIKDLNNPYSRVSQISRRIVQLITTRRHNQAFHPNGGQEILDISPAVFGVKRISPDRNEQVICLTNVTADVQQVKVSGASMVGPAGRWTDLITDQVFSAVSGDLTVTMSPYGVLWLEPWAG